MKGHAAVHARLGELVATIISSGRRADEALRVLPAPRNEKPKRDMMVNHFTHPRWIVDHFVLVGRPPETPVDAPVGTAGDVVEIYYGGEPARTRSGRIKHFRMMENGDAKPVKQRHGPRPRLK